MLPVTLSAAIFVAIQSHSPTPGGVFVRFDYRFERDRPVILKVIDDTDDTLLKVDDRPATPTDAVFFAAESRKARADRAQAGVVTKRDLELLSDEAARTKIFSIRSASADEADDNGQTPMTVEAKLEALARDNALMRAKLHDLEAKAMAEELKEPKEKSKTSPSVKG